MIEHMLKLKYALNLILLVVIGDLSYGSGMAVIGEDTESKPKSRKIEIIPNIEEKETCVHDLVEPMLMHILRCCGRENAFALRNVCRRWRKASERVWGRYVCKSLDEVSAYLSLGRNGDFIELDLPLKAYRTSKKSTAIADLSLRDCYISMKMKQDQFEPSYKYTTILSSVKKITVECGILTYEILALLPPQVEVANLCPAQYCGGLSIFINGDFGNAPSLKHLKHLHVGNFDWRVDHLNLLSKLPLLECLNMYDKGIPTSTFPNMLAFDHKAKSPRFARLKQLSIVYPEYYPARDCFGLHVFNSLPSLKRLKLVNLPLDSVAKLMSYPALERAYIRYREYMLRGEYFIPTLESVVDRKFEIDLAPYMSIQRTISQ